MDKPDFIIVGAGSAGSAVAERLSSNGRNSVLVLEAGGSDRRFYVQMPLGYGKLFFDPAVNWCYACEPDQGLAGNADFWPRGKILGGSSSINAMVWIHGSPRDYDDWRDAGNPGWGWADMLPAIRAIEDFEGGEDEWRGTGGPVHVSTIDRQLHPLTRAWFEACGQSGLTFNPDFNGASQEGFGAYQFNIRRGVRVSAARAFLRPAMKRANVRVVTGAHVTKVRFDGRRAIGVDYVRNGQRIAVDCGREIVLAGGSINTPQLLHLSGVGPARAIAGLGIPVVCDQPIVGRNLQDHQGINYTFRANRPSLNQSLRPWWGKALAGMRYLALRDGPLAMSINQGGGFFRTSQAHDRPNMQLYFQAFSTVIPRNGERPILTPDPFPGFSIGLSNCRPQSSGDVETVSPDPFAPPRIHSRAFAAESDVAEMLAAVKFIRTIAEAPAMRAVIEEEVLPGSAVRSDAELTDDFRRRSGTVFHPVGTCRMGPDAKNAVVSPRLRVHGLEGLRVVDCSVFPNNITGNTNVAAIATGWKGAGIILEDNA